MIFSTASSISDDIRLPQWGRAFWQDPNDGELFLAYASGTNQVNFITSTDDGETWTAPQFLFSVDDFSIHNNFDVLMDRRGHIHCGFRYNGSGCYQFVGKVDGGGWTRASGIGEVGLASAGDISTRARGFQGSLTIQESPFASEVAGVSFPAIKMALKNSSNDIEAFVVGTPYNTGPLPESMLFSSIAAGSDGGFPVVYVQDSSPPASQIIYYDDTTNSIKRWSRDFGSYFQYQTLSLGPGEVPFGPSMAIGSGTFSDHSSLTFCCSSGYGLPSVGQYIGQAMYQHANNNTYSNEYIRTFDISNGTQNYWIAKTGFENGDPSGIPQNSGVIPTGNLYGVGPNTFSPQGVSLHDFPGEGTNCDFTFNDNGDYIFYFQKFNEWGKQCIGRFKAQFDGDNWVFPLLGDEENGLKEVASVNTTHAGGFSNMLFWGSFKALKHPVEPSEGVSKLELLATQAHTPTYPSGGSLTVWNVLESPALRQWKVGEFNLDYIVTSGTANPIFIGVNAFENFSFPTHPEILGDMFDDDGSTFGRVRNGYAIGLEFDKPREFNAFEMLRLSQSTATPSVAISGSMDNINYNRVAFIPSGIIFGDNTYNDGNNLIKYTSRDPSITQNANNRFSQPVNHLHPFAAKYLRLHFSTDSAPTNSKNIYELKFFGPGATNPEIITWGDKEAGTPTYFREFATSSATTIIESFKRQEGTLPIGWRTYGDFEWGVVGSGDSVVTNSLPTAELPIGYDGLVPSGMWATTTVGNGRGIGDGFSIRSEAIGSASGLGNPLRTVPSDGIQPGHQAVLEVDIDIFGGELNSNSVTGRDVSFNIRSDVHVDDIIEFYIDNVLQQTYSDIGWNTFTSYTWGVDEFEPPESFPVFGTGPHTLKWIYKKGEYDPYAPTRVYPFGAAWIDRVGGLNAGPIEGGPRYHRFGYVKAGNGVALSSINGYAHAEFGGSQINGIIPFVDPLFSTVYGYLSASGTPASSRVWGFVHGSESGVAKINGYVIGSEDPESSSSSVLGFAVAGFGSGDMAGLGAINGYSRGVFGIGGDQIIFGYLAKDSGSEDFVFRNGFTIGWDGGVLGLGPNQSAIYGYSPGSNDYASGTINGFLLGNYPNSSIHGYMGSEALVPSGGGLVGNPSTSNVAPGINFVHGFLKGEIGSQAIHGYVKRPSGVFPVRKGYVLSGGIDSSVHGYLEAKDITPSQVHGYASGVGYAPSVINAYAFGISGIIDGAIHGYISAVNAPNSTILGTLIGTIDNADSSSACPSHNFPLPSLPPFTIPTTFFN